MSELGDTHIYSSYFCELSMPWGYGHWQLAVPNYDGSDEFRELARKIIPMALDECHPLIKRANVTFQFEGEEITEEPRIWNKPGWAELTKIKGKGLKIGIHESLLSIFIAEKRRPDTHWSITGIGILLHELFEADYEIKSMDLAQRAPRLSPNDPNYNTAEHEVIANERTLAMLSKCLNRDFEIQDGYIYAEKH